MEQQRALLLEMIIVKDFNGTCLWLELAEQEPVFVQPHWRISFGLFYKLFSLIGAVLIYTQNPCTPRRLLSFVLLSLAIVYYCATCNYWIHKC